MLEQSANGSLVREKTVYGEKTDVWVSIGSGKECARGKTI